MASPWPVSSSASPRDISSGTRGPGSMRSASHCSSSPMCWTAPTVSSLGCAASRRAWVASSMDWRTPDGSSVSTPISARVCIWRDGAGAGHCWRWRRSFRTRIRRPPPTTSARRTSTSQSAREVSSTFPSRCRFPPARRSGPASPPGSMATTCAGRRGCSRGRPRSRARSRDAPCRSRYSWRGPNGSAPLSKAAPGSRKTSGSCYSPSRQFQGGPPRTAGS